MAAGPGARRAATKPKAPRKSLPYAPMPPTPTLLYAVPLLVAAARAAPEVEYCEAHRQAGVSTSRPHCSHSVQLSGGAPRLFCAVNNPLMPTRSFLRGGLLRLFDAQYVMVRGERLRQEVEHHVASEDTWVQDVLGNKSVVARTLAAFGAPEESRFKQQLARLRRAVGAAWAGGDDTTITAAFSPFYTSCVGLRSLGGDVTLTVEWYRDGPSLHARWPPPHAPPREPSARGGKLEAQETVRQWSGVALLAAGLLLYGFSGSLAESIVFHYASAVSVSMVLGVLLLLLLVWSRTGRRRPFVALTAFLSLVGITATTLFESAKDAIVDLCRNHWQ